MKIFSYAYTAAESFIFSALKRFFFFGYKELPQRLIQERMRVLKSKGAKMENDKKIEAYYLAASGEVHDVIVFAHTSSFWQLLPKNYDYLRNRADVVLWNPSELTPCQYKKDLQSVIEKVQELHPNKTITIIGRCSTVDPAIAVAADLKNNNINLILDRGYGNVIKFARSLTYLSLLPIIRRVLLKHFDCKGEEKIKEVKGKILFIRSPYDQLTKWRNQDLTGDLIDKRGEHDGDQIIKFPNSDHWTRWNQDILKKVHEFTGLKEVDVSSFPEKSAPPTFFARNILPVLIQAWC